MVPTDDDFEIAAAMRAKLAMLDARLDADAAAIDEEGRRLIKAVREAARGVSQAIEGNDR